MARVRRATGEDAAALLDMGRAMHAESPHYQGRGWDDARVLEAIDLFTGPAAEAGQALLLVAEDGGELVGMAAVFVAQDWFGPDRYVTDRVVYVRPDRRGSPVFLRLVHAVEGWAQAIGVPEVTIGVSTGVHVGATVHAYQRLGYTLLPTRVVTKRLDHVQRN